MANTNSQKRISGTASTAAALALVAGISTATPTMLNYDVKFADAQNKPAIATSRLLKSDGLLPVSPVRADRTSQDSITINSYNDAGLSRSITELEQTVGELRSWGLFSANWDNEGAAAPDANSISSASAFVYALLKNTAIPEAMLHPNGHAGLLWNGDRFYADLEFYGDGRVTYFVRRSEREQHRGVALFNGTDFPSIFSSLLG